MRITRKRHKFGNNTGKKSPKNWGKLRKYIIIGIVLMTLLKLNPLVFFMSLFVILVFVGKVLRGMLGLSMVVFDPLLFFTVIILFP